MTRYITVNDRGLRIGQDHPKAVLTEIEVEALIADRGPEDAPMMSWSKLAAKYGVSKSCARDIVSGRRRGQGKRFVERQETHRQPRQKVRVNLRVTLRARTILHRLGGGAFIESIAKMVDAELRCAQNDDYEQAMARVFKRLGVMK